MPAPFLPLALILLAQTTAAPPPAPADPQAAVPPAPRCGVPTGENAIIICAERPEGYRINPDIMEAKRGMKSGRPRPNTPTMRPDCAIIGPAPCMTAGINLIGAALTAAEMASRLSQGKEIGSMFHTDPHPSEYQLYEMAKARREAQEAEDAAAKVKAKARAAEQAPAK